MKTVANSRKRVPAVFIGTTQNYRDNLIVKSARDSIVYLSTWANPNLGYQIVTEQLNAATHLFCIETRDNLNNLSDCVEGSVLIDEFTSPPRFIRFSYPSNRVVRITWTTPVTGNPDDYAVYSNNGSGDIDLNSHYDVLDGDVNSVEYNLNVDGIWLFKVESIVNSIESVTKFIIQFTIPFEDVVPPQVFNEEINIIAIYAQNLSVGRLNITFLWPYGPTYADKFRLYHDSGTGIIDYNTPFEFARADGFQQEYTTGQIYNGFDDQELLFVVRAVTAAGTEEQNTVEHSVILDGQAPAEISELTIGATL